MYNLDSIKAPGRAQLKIGLNAYLIDDQKILERNISFSHSSSTVEKIANRQGFICPVCGGSLKNSEPLEVHHSPSLKVLRLNHDLNKRIKLIVLHKLCHSRVHRDYK